MEELDEASISEFRAGGLRVLWEGTEPKVDIVAVHGLGANPDWAWVYKVKDKNGQPVLSDEGKPKLVNWLKDPNMLPAKLPQARVMTFNYLSKWHANSPVQRLALCAEQMADAIHTIRRQEPDSEYRPLVFVGHSYGGIVVQQALVFAEGNSEHRYLSIATIGVISLGTPFRGSAVTPWAEMIARTGNILGFGSSKDILEDLRKDSVRLTDLRHHFALWLFRQSVPVYCFFEQFLTDYGKRFGLTWKEMVVDENSACLDGHQRHALPTDHLKMNKFGSPQDPSYLQIASKLAVIIHGESKKVEQRRNPLKIVTVHTDWPPSHNSLMQDLYLTDPIDDLAAVKRAKGERVNGTCEWILTRAEYTRWLVEPQRSLLFITGDPGIGKTMIATFLTEELMRKASMHHQMAFAHYFCDNKDYTRRTAIGILRGLLLQLLGQRRAILSRLLQEHMQKGKALFENFDALCRILRIVLDSPDIGQIYFLIDALDECAKEEQDEILGFLRNISESAENVKMIITSRPIIEIMEIDRLIESGEIISSEMIRVDSGGINKDLASFIDRAVNKLPGRFPTSTKTKIRNALTDRAGGTFLWASLVLKDISKVRRIEIVDQKLRTLPKDLNEVYIRILREVDEDDAEDVRFILQSVTAALRPLSIQELAVARMIGRGYWNEATAPNVEDALEYEAGWQCCGALLRVDSHGYTYTINFIHQSVKDFLLKTPSEIHDDVHRQYSFHVAEAHTLMFEVCRNYLISPSFDDHPHGMFTVHETRTYDMHSSPFWGLLLNYSIEAWCEHALVGLAAEPQDIEQSSWFAEWQRRRPEMPGACLRRAVRRGNSRVVNWLIAMGVDVNSQFERSGTALILAIHWYRRDILELLLSHPNINMECKSDFNTHPIAMAADKAKWSMVDTLIRTGKCDINATTFDGGTLLHKAAADGVTSTVQLLLEHKDVLRNTSCRDGDSPLARAAANEHEACARLLLIHRVGVDGECSRGSSLPLACAAFGGSERCMELILTLSDADPDEADICGRTPLSYASEKGHLPCVELLLTRLHANGDPLDCNWFDNCGRSPLSYAAEQGHGACIDLLLRSSASFDVADYDCRTPLSYAAEKGHKSCVELLLTLSDVEPDTADDHGRTPLSYAAKYKSCIRSLLSRTDVIADSRNASGQTPLYYVIDSGSSNLRGYRSRLQLLLSRADVNANWYDEAGYPPLYWAAYRRIYAKVGHTPIAGRDYENYLASLETIASKSDQVLGFRDEHGRTILAMAARAWNEPCLSVLLRRSESLANDEDKTRRTPLAQAFNQLGKHLEYASRKPFSLEPLLKVAKTLIRSGADINHPSVRKEIKAFASMAVKEALPRVTDLRVNWLAIFRENGVEHFLELHPAEIEPPENSASIQEDDPRSEGEDSEGEDSEGELSVGEVSDGVVTDGEGPESTSPEGSVPKNTDDKAESQDGSTASTTETGVDSSILPLWTRYELARRLAVVLPQLVEWGYRL